MTRLLKSMGLAVLSMAALPASSVAGAAVSHAPLECTRGPADQKFDVIVRVPASAPAGTRFTIRVDGVSSGTISHVGLKYIHHMATDFSIPPEMKYVPGSLRIIPGTGTPNVRPGARVWHDAPNVRMLLPGHVESGSAYTAPSFELELEATGDAGEVVAFELDQFRLKAHVFLVGDLETICNPKPRPYALAEIDVRSE